MNIVIIMIIKEFKQIFRNKNMLPVIFILPIIQLLVLVNAATFEVTKINFNVIDKDLSSSSRKLINDLASTNYFFLNKFTNDLKETEKDLIKNNARMTLIIPEKFEKDIFNLQAPQLQIIINAEDASAASVIYSYFNNILMNFNSDILTERKVSIPAVNLSNIQLIERYWYNPKMNYKQYMVPGILGVLVSIIALLLTGMNVVREKELGTIEQLNVTPIKKYQFIIGKLLPFWIIGLFELAFGLTIAYLVYGLLLQGSIFLLFFLASIYLIVVLSIGLIISTISDTQQQSIFVSFFILILLVLMSGLFTPVDSMPHWAQVISFLDPFSHFVEILRRVMIKGAGINEVLKPASIILIYAIFYLTFAIIRYKKVSY